MRIAQITDLHIGQEGENTFDIDVRANFQRILHRIRVLAPDYMVVTGDLCYRDAAPEIMDYVKAELDRLDIPYYVIAGNHDDSTMLAQHFGIRTHLHDGELYYCQVLDGFPVLFLDSARGQLSARQKAWLQEQLGKFTGPALVFMHHPPLWADVPYMDTNFPLQDRTEVAAILQQAPYPVSVFCGHYHIDQTVHEGSLQVHITPSGFFQIDPASAEFAVEHHRVGFRDISWEADRIRHRVIWV